MKKVSLIVVLFGLIALYVFSASFLIDNSSDDSGTLSAEVSKSNYNIINNNDREGVQILNSEDEESKGLDIVEIELDIDIVNSGHIEEDITMDNDRQYTLGQDSDLSLSSEYNIVSENESENYSREFIGPIVESEMETVLVTSTNNRDNNIEVSNRVKESRSPRSLVEQIKAHKVQRGDNLWDIARKYNIDIDTLIGANDITNMNTIRIGDELRILPIKGILYTVNPGESLWTISRKFNIPSNKIVEANALSNPDLVKPGVSLILPGAKPEFGYQDRLADTFMRPVEGGRISSPFGPRWGRMHSGIDYAIPTGTQVRASRAGTVIYSAWATGYGETIVIEHQKGVRTLYAHNSRLLVRGGQEVERGQVIALSGNTGNSTGPHLHFEIQINGKAVDPMNYLP
ncbi:peptidoglycan DD-metalloendopeptidase family protein [Natronospora cellulosivora (SeqCode)]